MPILSDIERVTYWTKYHKIAVNLLNYIQNKWAHCMTDLSGAGVVNSDWLTAF